MLELVERVFDIYVLPVGIFQLEDDQRQPVDVDDQVRAAVIVPVN